MEEKFSTRRGTVSWTMTSGDLCAKEEIGRIRTLQDSVIPARVSMEGVFFIPGRKRERESIGTSDLRREILILWFA